MIDEGAESWKSPQGILTRGDAIEVIGDALWCRRPVDKRCRQCIAHGARRAVGWRLRSDLREQRVTVGCRNEIGEAQADKLSDRRRVVDPVAFDLDEKETLRIPTAQRGRGHV